MQIQKHKKDTNDSKINLRGFATIASIRSIIHFIFMSTLVSTRIKDPVLLREVEGIVSATDLGMADLLRMGLRHVVREFKVTGELKIPEIPPTPTPKRKGAR